MPAKTIPALIFFAASAAMTAPAIAGDYRVVVQEHELSTVGGAESVYNRLTQTAEQTCTSNGIRRPLYAIVLDEDCTDQLIEAMVAQISHPRLNQVHAAAKSEGRYASR